MSKANDDIEIANTLLIKERFERDKKNVITVTNDYLSGSLKSAPSLDSAQLRDSAQQAINDGNITGALQSLEQLRDAKTGINHTIIPSSEGITPVLIRDARNCTSPATRETESFEMQYLNAIRAAIDLAPALESELKTQAKAFMDPEKGFYAKAKSELTEDLSTEENQRKLSKLIKKDIGQIETLLEKNGISKAAKKLNIAKDFQNFNDTHHNIVTLSTVGGRTIAETEIAMKGLTRAQQTEYNAITNNNSSQRPKWFTSLPEWEQGLVKKYSSKITAGSHVMATQLRELVGMKNAFEKITMIAEPGRELETIHSVKHAGTLASFSAAPAQEAQRIANLNGEQAKEWVGTGANLHCNTLNSSVIGSSTDKPIVTQTSKIPGISFTNTAFNALRIFGVNNEYGGAKKLVANILDKIEDPTIKEDLRPHLGPKTIRERLFGPKKDLEKAMSGLGDDAKSIIRQAVALKSKINAANSFIRMGDKENLSLQVSTAMGVLASDIKATKTKTSNMEGLNLSTVTDELLVMCASGKDRTGLAMHDQSAQAISRYLEAKGSKIAVEEIDERILAAGHTAGQAGGVFAGGATIGCFGTKSENAAGIPQSRKKLSAIIEASANNNKIKPVKNKDAQVEIASSTSQTPTKVVVIRDTVAPSAARDLQAKTRSSEARKIFEKNQGALLTSRNSASPTSPSTSLRVVKAKPTDSRGP